MGNSIPNFTIVKPEQKGGWTMLWNDYVIRNKALNPNEKEMLSIFLSFEDGSENVCKKSVYYYCSAQNEKTNDKTFSSLKRKGHLKLIKNIDPINHKIWWEYEVYQKPLDVPVEQFETRYTTAPDKMLRKASPDVVAQLAEKYGLDPSVVENLHADLVMSTPPAQPSTPSIVAYDFYDDLVKSTSELERIALKYELNQEELSKHLENFKKNKKALTHTNIDTYKEHFDNYVGKCLTSVKTVVKARNSKAKAPKLKTDYTPQSDEELLAHTRKLYADIKEVSEDIPFSEYREQTDLFIKYASECEQKGLSNAILLEIRDFYAKLRKEAGGLKKYYDEQLKLLNPDVSVLIKTVVAETQKPPPPNGDG